MKKIFFLLAAIIFFIISYLLVLELYPKNAGRFPIFILFFLFDLYLWFSVRSWIKKRKLFGKILFGGLYWLPFALIIFLVIADFFIPNSNWNNSLRTYLFGFVFISYASKLLPVTFLIFADIIRFFQYLHNFLNNNRKKNSNVSGGQKISRSKFLKKIGFISGGILFSGLFFGMLKWVFDFRIKKEIIFFKNLPKIFNRLKIVQISDLHLGGWTSGAQLWEVVRIINNLDPDIVFFTGDLVNFRTDEAFRFKNILSEIKSKFGIFTVLGNHDYGDYTKWENEFEKEQNLLALFKFYKDIGWKLLNNRNMIINRGGDRIAILGVENWGAHSRFQKNGKIGEALRGADGIPFKILLSHDPSYWDEIISKNYQDIDITFSGHTHGFQFGFEFKNFKWSPAQYMYKHWAGLYGNQETVSKPQYLYVNRGLGTIGYPGRIGILPEITLFELRT